MKLLIAFIFSLFVLYGQESSTFSESSTFNREDDQEKKLTDRYPIDDGKMFEENILKNNDTLLVTRTYGDHFFGLFAGPNISILTGDVRWAGNPLAIAPGEYPDPDRDPIVDYRPSRVNADYNWFPGFIYEYAPVHWDFGFALRVFPYETVSYQAEYLVPDDQATRENERFIFSSQIPYTGFSPQATYKIRYLDLKVWAGADLFFSIGEDNTNIERDYETATGELEIPRVIDNLENPPIRYGFNLGIEYEYLIMDIFSSTRVKLAPYFMAEWTTSYISDFGSNVSPVIMRAGIAVKLGPDRTTYDTLKYVPKINRNFIAKFEERRRVTFEGFLNREEIVASGLDYIEAPQVFADISDEPEFISSGEDLIENQINSEPEETVENLEEKLEINNPGAKSFGSFPKNGTRLSKELREYADDLVDWMKLNPNTEIRVVGHASRDEEFREQQKISEERARRVQTYMQRKGINPRRVLVSGVGARQPKSDNSTEEGRRENRRVDITIVK